MLIIKKSLSSKSIFKLNLNSCEDPIVREKRKSRENILQVLFKTTYLLQYYLPLELSKLEWLGPDLFHVILTAFLKGKESLWWCGQCRKINSPGRLHPPGNAFALHC